ncbi:ketosteroid isomerase-like protein [Pseudoduganella lurida]|uniref:Ketosteroid isomerase-like protein n=1 Tax=Pseudoduganella lurida TaxID=1036180 RepID=A0A562QVV2_9BURK|nr:nuclear transport factor 2 family protein [Pseudoduganella lurida]TWI60909.1 ketosteroid isomerase-like protein [Pseudoduganella lurida]
MSELNKSVLQQANAAVTAGDNEGFLAFCAEDIAWSTVGAETLHGKGAVRAWMAKEYTQPPSFTVHNLIGDGDFVAALGDIEGKDADGKPTRNAYCDVWRFRDGKMVELRAFVIEVAK